MAVVFFNKKKTVGKEPKKKSAVFWIDSSSFLWFAPFPISLKVVQKMYHWIMIFYIRWKIKRQGVWEARIYNTTDFSGPAGMVQIWRATVDRKEWSLKISSCVHPGPFFFDWAYFFLKKTPLSIRGALSIREHTGADAPRCVVGWLTTYDTCT